MTDIEGIVPRADPGTAHSVPLDVPLHGRPPARFRDGEVLTLQYRTDPDAIAALLPAPLVAAGDTVMVQVARWGDVPGLGRDTHEANVMVAAELTTPAGNSTQTFDLPPIPDGCDTNKDCPNGGSAQGGETSVGGGGGPGAQLKGEGLSSSR